MLGQQIVQTQISLIRVFFFGGIHLHLLELLTFSCLPPLQQIIDYKRSDSQPYLFAGMKEGIYHKYVNQSWVILL